MTLLPGPEGVTVSGDVCIWINNNRVHHLHRVLGLLKANLASGSKYGAARGPVNTDLEICHEEETQSRSRLLSHRPCLCINKQSMEILIRGEHESQESYSLSDDDHDQ